MPDDVCARRFPHHRGYFVTRFRLDQRFGKDSSMETCIIPSF